jgi:hypothetical protein
MQTPYNVENIVFDVPAGRCPKCCRIRCRLDRGERFFAPAACHCPILKPRNGRQTQRTLNVGATSNPVQRVWHHKQGAVEVDLPGKLPNPPSPGKSISAVVVGVFHLWATTVWVSVFRKNHHFRILST